MDHALQFGDISGSLVDFNRSILGCFGPLNQLVVQNVDLVH